MASELSRTSFSLSSKLLGIYQRLEKKGSVCKSLNLATLRRWLGPTKNFESCWRLPKPANFALLSEHCTELSFLTFANTFCVVRAGTTRLAQEASVHYNGWPMMNFRPFLCSFIAILAGLFENEKMKKP